MATVVRQAPKTGWLFDSLSDLKYLDPDHECTVKCDRCNRRLRFVHRLRHPDWHKPLRVGLCCSVRLAGDNYDAQGAERAAGNRGRQLTRFLNPAKWQRSGNGNPTRMVMALRVTIFSQGSVYNFVVADREGPTFGNCYLSEAAAKHGAFEVVQRQLGQQ